MITGHDGYYEASVYIVHLKPFIKFTVHIRNIKNKTNKQKVGTKLDERSKGAGMMCKWGFFWFVQYNVIYLMKLLKNSVVNLVISMQGFPDLLVNV